MPMYMYFSDVQLNTDVGNSVTECSSELRHEKTNVLHMRNKDANQLRGMGEADQRLKKFVFATYIVQSLYFLNPKFQASSHLL